MVYIILCLVLLIMLEQCKSILRDANGINLHSLCRPHVCVDRHAHGPRGGGGGGGYSDLVPTGVCR